jgi:hypothetical protein
MSDIVCQSGNGANIEIILVNTEKGVLDELVLSIRGKQGDCRAKVYLGEKGVRSLVRLLNETLGKT